ncbi:inosine-5-monophosphate dehydrogenase [Devosia sp. Root436]|uniref:CBS domain-containing protein n=1 Tax=Devosia sp. Root436 TaxID=1736537 RepID=UPI0006FD207D|nr:CBS domain-containing protein [Devosia sp. Root436]KQX39987.1 inosine-5-monophosphate dehydrogenase [Devosia sp. Root436]
MLVDTILQTKGVIVHTLPETDTLADAVSLLNAHNIGAVVITDTAGAITGILSERDIIRRLGKDPAGALALPIGKVMTRGVVTCRRDTNIAEVMERMTSLRIRHMPVAETGKLVGIVSIGDVVKYKIQEAEHEAEVLREYIAS